MSSGRTPEGEQPLVVCVTTKVTADERDWLVREFGSAYAGMRMAFDLLKVASARKAEGGSSASGT